MKEKAPDSIKTPTNTPETSTRSCTKHENFPLTFELKKKKKCIFHGFFPTIFPVFSPTGGRWGVKAPGEDAWQVLGADVRGAGTLLLRPWKPGWFQTLPPHLPPPWKDKPGGCGWRGTGATGGSLVSTWPCDHRTLQLWGTKRESPVLTG